MNLFRKKTHIFASFGEKELTESPGEILKSLESLLPVPDGLELRISIAENTDLSMESLCSISYFSSQQKEKGLRVVLKAKQSVVDNLNATGLGVYFDELMVGE